MKGSGMRTKEVAHPVGPRDPLDKYFPLLGHLVCIRMPAVHEIEQQTSMRLMVHTSKAKLLQLHSCLASP